MWGDDVICTCFKFTFLWKCDNFTCSYLENHISDFNANFTRMLRISTPLTYQNLIWPWTLLLSRANVSRSKSILLTLHPSQPQQAHRPVGQVGRSPLKFLPHRKLEFAIDFTIFYIFGPLKKFSPPLEPILHPSVPCLAMGLSHSFASYIITRPTF